MNPQGLVGKEFKDELEVFRTEEETAQQCFFAYLGIRNLAAESREVLRAMNENPMFWITSEYSLILSTFIILGRIFDTDSKHNVGKLMGVVESDRAILSRTGLKLRREAEMTASGAAEYVKSKHDLTVSEVRETRKLINTWRKVYEQRYKPIRNLFAHKKLTSVQEVNQVMAKADIEEMKKMLGFLHSLHEALIELYLNGSAPLPLREIKFVPLSEAKPARQYYPGEKAYREAQSSLKMMLALGEA